MSRKYRLFNCCLDITEVTKYRLGDNEQPSECNTKEDTSTNLLEVDYF